MDLERHYQINHASVTASTINIPDDLLIAEVLARLLWSPLCALNAYKNLGSRPRRMIGLCVATSSFLVRCRQMCSLSPVRSAQMMKMKKLVSLMRSTSTVYGSRLVKTLMTPRLSWCLKQCSRRLSPTLSSPRTATALWPLQQQQTRYTSPTQLPRSLLLYRLAIMMSVRSTSRQLLFASIRGGTVCHCEVLLS